MPGVLTLHFVSELSAADRTFNRVGGVLGPVLEQGGERSNKLVPTIITNLWLEV